MASNVKNTLKYVTKIRGAKRYADWLGEQKDVRSDALAAAASAAKRRGSYGRAGEVAASAGLAGDGYAEYLRLAAKQTETRARRAASQAAATTDRAQAAGYASYLQEKKQERVEDLAALSEEVMKSVSGMETVRELLAEAEMPEPVRGKLLADYRAYLKDKQEAQAPSIEKNLSVLRMFVEKHFSREAAYRFCLAAGMKEADARRMADYLEYPLKDELQNAYGDFVGPPAPEGRGA